MEDIKYLIYKTLDKEFISPDTKKNIKIVLHIKFNLKPEFVLIDNHGKVVDVEINSHGMKTMVVGLSNESKSVFFKNLMEMLTNMPYVSWCLERDWNSVISPQRDRTAETKKKSIKVNYKKLF